jgi:uncharacterized integral membrane protein
LADALASVFQDFVEAELNLSEYFKIDPLKSFVEQRILWVVVIVLSSVAAIIAIIIVCNSNLEVALDYRGFNSFVEIFKVPIALLAITATLAALLATIHRSAQTREQIITANKQNIFSNYYKHIEEFEKYIHASIVDSHIHFQNLRMTHKYLFPKSLYGDYSVNDEFLNLIDKECSKSVSQLQRFDQAGEKPIFDIFHDIYSSIDHVFSFLSVKIGRSGRQVVQDGKKIAVPTYDLKGAFSVVKDNSAVLEQMLLFNPSVIVPSSLKRILSMNLSVVPQWSFQSRTSVERFDVFSAED